MEQFRFSKFILKMPQPHPDVHKEFSKFSLQVFCWEFHFNMTMEQFRFSNFSLKVLQPLPDIQKGFFEIQINCLEVHFQISIQQFRFSSYFDFWNSVCRCYNHFRISKKEFLKFSLQVNCWEVLSQISICIEQFRFPKFSLQVLQLQSLPRIQNRIFEIQLAG